MTGSATRFSVLSKGELTLSQILQLHSATADPGKVSSRGLLDSATWTRPQWQPPVYVLPPSTYFSGCGPSYLGGSYGDPKAFPSNLYLVSHADSHIYPRDVTYSLRSNDQVSTFWKACNFEESVLATTTCHEMRLTLKP